MIFTLNPNKNIKKMQSTPRPSTERQTPAYKVTINTSTFKVNRSAEK